LLFEEEMNYDTGIYLGRRGAFDMGYLRRGLRAKIEATQPIGAGIWNNDSYSTVTIRRIIYFMPPLIGSMLLVILQILCYLKLEGSEEHINQISYSSSVFLFFGFFSLFYFTISSSNEPCLGRSYPACLVASMASVFLIFLCSLRTHLNRFLYVEQEFNLNPAESFLFFGIYFSVFLLLIFSLVLPKFSNHKLIGNPTNDETQDT
jgi:hypothetical protein